MWQSTVKTLKAQREGPIFRSVPTRLPLSFPVVPGIPFFSAPLPSFLFYSCHLPSVPRSSSSGGSRLPASAFGHSAVSAG